MPLDDVTVLHWLELIERGDRAALEHLWSDLVAEVALN